MGSNPFHIRICRHNLVVTPNSIQNIAWHRCLGSRACIHLEAPLRERLNASGKVARTANELRSMMTLVLGATFCRTLN